MWSPAFAELRAELLMTAEAAAAAAVAVTAVAVGTAAASMPSADVVATATLLHIGAGAVDDSVGAGPAVMGLPSSTRWPLPAS